MAAEQDFTLGEHNAAIRQLLADSAQTRIDVADIRMILAEQRGERRAAVWFASTAGAVMGAALAFVAKYFIGMIRVSTS